MTGSAPNEEAVALAQIVAALSVTYTDEGVAVWLSAHNKAFDGDTALEWVLAGRIEAVAAAVRRIGDADPTDFVVVDAAELAAARRDLAALRDTMTDVLECARSFYRGDCCVCGEEWPCARVQAIDVAFLAASGSVPGQETP